MALDLAGAAPVVLPDRRGLCCGGAWHDAAGRAVQKMARS